MKREPAVTQALFFLEADCFDSGVCTPGSMKPCQLGCRQVFGRGPYRPHTLHSAKIPGQTGISRFNIVQLESMKEIVCYDVEGFSRLVPEDISFKDRDPHPVLAVLPTGQPGLLCGLRRTVPVHIRPTSREQRQRRWQDRACGNSAIPHFRISETCNGQLRRSTGRNRHRHDIQTSIDPLTSDSLTVRFTDLLAAGCFRMKSTIQQPIHDIVNQSIAPPN